MARSTARRRFAWVCFALLGVCGCASGSADEPPPGPIAPAADTSAGQRPNLCERAGDDEIRDAFCGGPPATVRSLGDLQALVDLKPGLQDDSDIQPDTPFDPYTVNRFVVALGHSTALAGKVVSPINPRVIVLGRNTIMAYQRGVQHIELASRRQRGAPFKFYLLSFLQDCNASADGCTPGDLFTPRIENDWTQIALRDDDDLANTALDCRQCHQRGTETPTLLMRELQSPWTHFFETLPDVPADGLLPGVRGLDLVRDYLRAKGDEPYAGITSDTLRRTSPAVLETTMMGFPQPLLFDAPAIDDERWPFGPDGYATEAQPSPTWERAYAAFKRGEQLAIPYYETRPTDPRKQAALTHAYVLYRAGQLDPSELPDLADIFPDDPSLRARIGLQTEPDATPGDALIQACGSCHNDVLDQSLSRARFNIDLARLDPAEIALAIDRIERPRGEPGAMPPSEARQLTPAARTRLLDFLRDAQRPSEFDAALRQAAAMGMARSGAR